MIITEQKAWSDRVVQEGVVSVRDLSQHTTQVLKAVEKRGRPVLVSRHSKIVATIAPITMREIVDTVIANDRDLRNSMSLAEEALSEGKTRSAAEVLSETGETD